MGLRMRHAVRMVAVSVVVPVYNPGDRIRTALDSLDAQTMRDFEVVLVDDGSTDGSLEVLQRYAAARDNVVLTSIPASGWAGRPRNVGTDLATGEYVLFMDHDDGLPPDALEVWHRYAVECDADICVGKEGRPGGMSAGLNEFVRDVPDAQLVRDRLALLWTPHKLYRRSLLVEHGLRFPEGPTRLEDHHLNVRAFHRARRVALLSSRVVYWWNSPREITHSARFESLDIYWGALNGLMDLVEAEWPEGPERDAIMLRWWAYKVLKRASAPRYSSWSAAFRATIFPHLQQIDARFPARLHTALPPVRRLQSMLLRAGDEDGLMAVARTQADIRVEARNAAVRWDCGTLTVDVELHALTSDGPFATGPGPGSELPWGQVGEAVRPDLRTDLVAELTGASVRAVLRDLAAGEDWPLPTVAEPSPQPTADGRLAAVLRVRTEVDLRTGRAGRPLDEARHEVVIAMDWFGRRFRTRVPVEVGRLAAMVDDRQAYAYRSNRGGLRLQVGRGMPVWLRAVPDPGAGRVDPGPMGLHVSVPLGGVDAAGSVDVPVDLRVGRLDVPGRLVAVGERVNLEFGLSRRALAGQLPRHPEGAVPVRWAGPDGAGARLLDLRVRPRGVSLVSPGPPPRRPWRRRGAL